MKLPNAERALVEREKIVNYLLNPAHPDNGGKAAFFWDSAMIEMTGWPWQPRFAGWPRQRRSAQSMETAHGTK